MKKVLFVLAVIIGGSPVLAQQKKLQQNLKQLRQSPLRLY